MSDLPRTSEPPEAPASAAGVVGRLRKDKLRAALFDEPAPLRRLGRYRVLGTLGRGGMGTVLEAVDDALERRVAIKVLHRDVSPRDQGRLLREARALARLSHPNVVQVHEVGEEPRPFIAMELVRGRTLAQWQRERPPWRACVLAYLQRAQVVMERAYGPDHPELIPLLVNLAQVKHRRRDHAAGILLIDRAQAIAEHSLPEDSQMRGDPWVAKGRIELELGHASAALGLAEEALRLWERTDAPLFKRGLARFVLAKALAALDPPRPDEAAREAQRVVHELEAVTDSRSVQLRDEVVAWLESLKRRRDPPR